MLFNLTMAQPWLERRQDELLHTLDMCLCIEEQKLLCDLIYRFKYISSQGFGEGIGQMANQISNVWSCAPDKTIIVAINRSDFSDSSQAVLWHLKPAMARVEGWGTRNFVAKMSDAVARSKNGDSIILIDEFAGTGETLERAIRWFQKKTTEGGKEVTLQSCVLAAMEAKQASLALRTDGNIGLLLT